MGEPITELDLTNRAGKPAISYAGDGRIALYLWGVRLTLTGAQFTELCDAVDDAWQFVISDDYDEEDIDS